MQQKHSYLNSLKPSDALWHWRHWSTLVKLHVMACCLMVPSHYLNQYWLITTEVLRWYSPGCSFTGNVQDIYLPLICIWKLLIKNIPGDDGLIVLFHKSQCALRYVDLMSKIQNTSSQCSLATWLTVTANEQNGDWPAPVSPVSVQPVIGWLKYEVARQWSHIVHRPRPHGNVTLPMRSSKRCMI